MLVYPTMTKNKSLLTLDSDCHDILNRCDNKSEYARKAIKFFNKHEKKNSEKVTESSKMLDIGDKPRVRELN